MRIFTKFVKVPIRKLCPKMSTSTLSKQMDDTLKRYMDEFGVSTDKPIRISTHADSSKNTVTKDTFFRRPNYKEVTKEEMEKNARISDEGIKEPGYG